MLANPLNYFANLPDPRRQTRNKLHKLEDWVSIEDFGHENEQWLRGFLELRNGIPSHDTLSDVMGRIDRAAFARAFGEWMQQGLPSLAGQQVALDGKSLRGSRDGQQPAVHLMSAFATQARSVLGVQAVANKSNEIKAIPELLARLERRRVVVSTKLDWLEARPEWAGLQAVAMVESSARAQARARWPPACSGATTCAR